MTSVPYNPHTPQNGMGITYVQQTGTTYPQREKDNSIPVTTPIHPQPAQIYPQQPVPQPVARPGPMAAVAQHWTPPVGPRQGWQHGMCDCFDDWGICCLGYWLPCVLYSRTHHRLRTSPSTVSDFSCCNPVCMCICNVSYTRQRDEIRYRYNLEGSQCGDYWRASCCTQCVLCQEELEVRDRERQAAQTHSAGYTAQQQMAYTQPPPQQQMSYSQPHQ